MKGCENETEEQVKEKRALEERRLQETLAAEQRHDQREEERVLNAEKRHIKRESHATCQYDHRCVGPLIKEANQTEEAERKSQLKQSLFGINHMGKRDWHMLHCAVDAEERFLDCLMEKMKLPVLMPGYTSE